MGEIAAEPPVAAATSEGSLKTASCFTYLEGSPTR